MRKLSVCVLPILFAVSCGESDEGPPDATVMAGDAAGPDAASPDAASPDAASPDAAAAERPLDDASGGLDAAPAHGADAGADQRPSDAEIDAGPAACVPGEHRITEAAGESTMPALVAVPGGGFAVVWLDTREGQPNPLYFARLDANGNKIGGDVRVTQEGGGLPSLVWNGSGYAVAFGTSRIPDNAEVYFARIDSGGRLIDQELRVTNAPLPSLYASLAYTGSSYGVAWNDLRTGSADIRFARIDAAGAKLGDDVPISDSMKNEFRPWLVWNGQGFGLTWNDERDGDWEIYFALLDADGKKRAPEHRITTAPGPSLFPALVWTGSGYGLTWNDNRDGRAGAYFRRLDAAALPVGDELLLGVGSPMSGRESLVWTGQGFGVAISDPRDSVQRLQLARLDAAGAPAGLPAVVASAPDYKGGASLAAVGGGFGIAWQDARHGQAEIYFARFCP